MSDSATTFKGPLATIIVRAFNQEGTVSEAVESALEQTYQPLEVVLSDDASDDETFAVIQRLAADYRGPHSVILNRNERNLGIVGHVNRSVEIAKGALLLSCAGDDIAHPDKAAELVQAWVKGRGRVTAVHSSVMQIDGAGQDIGVRRPREEIVASPDPVTIARTKASCIGATALWDRRLFEVFGPLPEVAYVEDGPLFFRAALLGEIAYIDEPLVRYRLGGVSQTRPVSPGHDYLRGDRIKFMRWTAGNMRAHLKDLEKVSHRDSDQVTKLCEAYLSRAEFELGLAGRSPLGRVGALPKALSATFKTRDAFFLRQTIKHALGPAYANYVNQTERRAS